MTKLNEILELEKDRHESDKWNVIHLFKTGGFWSAYEWSAWLIAVIAFNDEVRMRTKDRKPLAVSRYASEDGNSTFCKVGFPLKSIDKFIPERLEVLINDDKHLALRISLPPADSDGVVTNYETISGKINEWRDAQTLKERGNKKKKPAASAPAPPQQHTATSGIISQILAYPLSQRTAAENIAFISELKKQITSIL